MSTAGQMDCTLSYAYCSPLNAREPKVVLAQIHTPTTQIPKAWWNQYHPFCLRIDAAGKPTWTMGFNLMGALISCKDLSKWIYLQDSGLVILIRVWCLIHTSGQAFLTHYHTAALFHTLVEKKGVQTHETFYLLFRKIFLQFLQAT